MAVHGIAKQIKQGIPAEKREIDTKNSKAVKEGNTAQPAFWSTTMNTMTSAFQHALARQRVRRWVLRFLEVTQKQGSGPGGVFNRDQ